MAQTLTKFSIDRVFSVPAPSAPSDSPGVRPFSLASLYLREGAPPPGGKRIFTVHGVGQLELLLLPPAAVWLRTPDGQQHRIPPPTTSRVGPLPGVIPVHELPRYADRLRVVPWGDAMLFAVDVVAWRVWGELRCGVMVPLAMRAQSDSEYLLW